MLWRSLKVFATPWPLRLLAFFLWRRSLEHTSDFERTLILGLESSPAGICRLDGKGCVVQCNRAFADFLGYTERELLGMQYANLLHADETKGMLWSGAAKEGSGEHAARIEKYYGKDGEVRWAKAAVSVLGDNDSRAGAMVIVQDMSPQQEALQSLENGAQALRELLSELQRNEQQVLLLAQAVESTSDSIVITDLRRADRICQSALRETDRLYASGGLR